MPISHQGTQRKWAIKLRFLLRIVVILILVSVYNDSLSRQREDTVKNTLFFGIKLHKGFIIPHYKELKPISSTYPWGFQLDASKSIHSDKNWVNCNCYSRIGLSFIYFDYLNPDILGHSYNLVLFGEPYLTFKKKLHFSLRGGMGVTYLDQVYDAVSNPENVFYSSPISFLLALNIIVNYKIMEQLNLNAAVNYNHISNAGSGLPNKGMNFPTFSIGTDYIINPVTLMPKPRQNSLRSRGLIKYVTFFSSIRTVAEDSLNEKANKLMIGFAGGISGPITNINAWSAGIEFSYDGSYQERTRRAENDFSPLILSILAGHAFVFGKFSFSQQMAWYAWRPFPENDHTFFQRYGIHYQLGKYLTVGASLKAHGHVAEHMDIRLGAIF